MQLGSLPRGVSAGTGACVPAQRCRRSEGRAAPFCRRQLITSAGTRTGCRGSQPRCVATAPARQFKVTRLAWRAVAVRLQHHPAALCPLFPYLRPLTDQHQEMTAGDVPCCRQSARSCKTSASSRSQGSHTSWQQRAAGATRYSSQRSGSRRRRSSGASPARRRPARCASARWQHPWCIIPAAS